MKKILVVAESTLLRKVLQMVLENARHSVDLACSSNAIKPSHLENCHLVIVDGQRGEEADEVLFARRIPEVIPDRDAVAWEWPTPAVVSPHGAGQAD